MKQSCLTTTGSETCLLPMISNNISQPGELRRARMVLACLPIWKKTRVSTMGNISSQSEEHLPPFDLDQKDAWGLGGGNNNNDNNAANLHRPAPSPRAPPQQIKLSPLLSMKNTGTKTRMPTSPLLLPSTMWIGRRRGWGRRPPLRHRNIWQPPYCIGPTLFRPLV